MKYVHDMYINGIKYEYNGIKTVGFNELVDIRSFKYKGDRVENFSASDIDVSFVLRDINGNKSVIGADRFLNDSDAFKVIDNVSGNFKTFILDDYELGLIDCLNFVNADEVVDFLTLLSEDMEWLDDTHFSFIFDDGVYLYNLSSPFELKDISSKLLFNRRYLKHKLLYEGTR